MLSRAELDTLDTTDVVNDVVMLVIMICGIQVDMVERGSTTIGQVIQKLGDAIKNEQPAYAAFVHHCKLFLKHNITSTSTVLLDVADRLDELVARVRRASPPRTSPPQLHLVAKVSEQRISCTDAGHVDDAKIITKPIPIRDAPGGVPSGVVSRTETERSTSTQRDSSDDRKDSEKRAGSSRSVSKRPRGKEASVPARGGRGPRAASPRPPDAEADGPPYGMRIGGMTHPGGSKKPNQDRFDMFMVANGEAVVMTVLDGHGTEFGGIASETARKALREHLSKTEQLELLRDDPQQFFADAFKTANDCIRDRFCAECESRGFEVMAEGGVLRRRRRGEEPWHVVSGGTTTTMAVLLDGAYLLLANVGDSSAILCGTACGALVHDVRNWSRRDECPEHLTLSGVRQPEADRTRAIPLTRDHSPQDIDEWNRIVAAQAPDAVPRFLFSQLNGAPGEDIYDDSGGEVRVITENAAYRKSVNGTIASVLATPATAAHQEALGMTRSLGDFHMQSYGVTPEPDVVWLHLGHARSNNSGVEAAAGGAGGGAAAAEAAAPTPFCLMMCTDGVWDNWRFSEISEWVMARSRVEAVLEGRDEDAHASELMQETRRKGEAHFGQDADNMTCLLSYLVPPAADGGAARASTAKDAASAADDAASTGEGNSDGAARPMKKAPRLEQESPVAVKKPLVLFGAGAGAGHGSAGSDKFKPVSCVADAGDCVRAW